MFLGTVTSLNVTLNSSSPICGSNTKEVLFVNSKEDLELLRHCETFNSSLFLTGGYEIDTLEPLSNTERILGYLVIIDSHVLYDLYGLHNLEQVGDNEHSSLYIDNFGITIRHNVNDTNRGLCYANRINWDLLTSADKWVDNNGRTCPMCDIECNGCWSMGPRLCQQCKNYKSGLTCVTECPRGSVLNGSVCLEKLPNKPTLSGEIINESSVRLFWEDPYEPNGVTMGYNMYQENEPVFLDQFVLNSNRTTLSNNLVVSGLDTYSLNNFTVRIFNSKGYSNLSDITSLRTSVGLPPKPKTPLATLVNNNIVVNLEEVSDIYGPVYKYKLTSYTHNGTSVEYEGTPLYSNFFNVTIIDIIPNVNYSFVLEAYTSEILKSTSDMSNSVLLVKRSTRQNNEPGSGDTNTDALYVTILSVILLLGFVILVWLINIIHSKCINRGIGVTHEENVGVSINNPLYVGNTNNTNNQDYLDIYDEPPNTNNNHIYSTIEGNNEVDDNISEDSDPETEIINVDSLYSKVRKTPVLHPKNMLRE